MNTKKLLTGLGALIILIALFIGSSALRDKYYTPTNEAPAATGPITIENKTFGYKFEMPAELFAGYKEERQGYSTIYYIPTRNLGLSEAPRYDRSLEVFAVPVAMNAELLKRCQRGEIVAPRMCQDFSSLEQKSEMFYFEILGRQESELLNATDEATIAENNRIFEQLLDGTKSTFQTYKVDKPNSLVYQDIQTGFQYEYPAELDNSFGESSWLSMPFGLQNEPVEASSPGLIKTLPIRYCALSGECKNTTTNMEVSIGVFGTDEKYLRESEIGSSLEKSTIGGKTVYTYNIGAEGEGINYHFVFDPVNKKMFTVSHRYIDENTLIAYKTAKGFIPYEQQKQIVTKLIQSISFTKPIQ